MSVPPEEVSRAGLRWWRYAEDDLELAERAARPPDPIFHSVCFASQQAVEKALKTVLVFLQMPFTRTHNLDRLRRLVPEGWVVRRDALDLEWLTEWGVAGRYPENLPEAGEADAERALTEAREILDLVRADLQAKGLLG